MSVTLLSWEAKMLFLNRNPRGIEVINYPLRSIPSLNISSNLEQLKLISQYVID
jgi:hypothetical protein